jgi:hypothetical protein
MAMTLASTVGAHEISSGNSSSTGKWRAARSAHMPTDPALKSLARNRAGLTQPLLSVIVLPNRWVNGSTIHACFYAGSDATRKSIVAAAQPWFQWANIKLDAGEPVPRTCAADHDVSEIRIGFDEPGYWSYIGTDGISSDLTANNLSSLNLQGFDVAPPAEPAFSGTVLHEFGHALGLHHEHQSPANTCDQFVDKPKLYARYKKLYGWDAATVDQNVWPLMADHSAFDWTPTVDLASIMIYATDKAYMMANTPAACIFHENYTLSAMDQEGIKRAYPMTGDVALSNALQAASIDVVLQRTQLDEPIKKALSVQRDLIKAAAAVPL